MESQFSLYEHFGKFMGQEANYQDTTFKAIQSKAGELNLKTRFMGTQHPQDDFGEKQDRLNVVVKPDTHIVTQIALG